MKKGKLLILGLVASAFGLSSCYVDLGFVQFGKLDETTNKTSSGGQSTNNHSNTNGENQTNDGTLLSALKNLAKPVAAQVLNKSESSITFGEYEDEQAQADVYYYDSSSLTFVDIEDYSENFDQTAADTLATYLPSGAALDYNNDNFEYGEYGMYYYDRYYVLGDYTFNIYVEAYDEYDWGDGDVDPAETYSSVFIYKTSQENAFNDYFSAEE